MSESEDLAAQARFTRSVVEDLIRKAKRLRKRAEELERESDRIKAAAARELADYFEGTAADLRGP